MTVILCALAGLVAALGTRGALVVFIAAAVAATGRDDIAAIGTWTPALAAGWILLTDRPVRTIALPALGAASVLAAGTARNGAVVLGLWVVGTAAAIVAVLMEPSPSVQPAGRRWALGLTALDIVLAGLVASSAGRGFEGWPVTGGTPVALVLVACAVLRAPFAAGPADRLRLPGLLIVRAQTVVLVMFASTVGGVVVGRTLLAVGAIGFVLAHASTRRAVIDVSQELSLAAMAVAIAVLGWGPSGWLWGALAAGTLMHQLRFTVAGRGPGAIADRLGRSAGIGLPFLPVIAAVLEGASHAAGTFDRGLRALVVVAIGLGLAAHSREPSAAGRERSSGEERRAVGILVLVGAASLWATLLAWPLPPAGETTWWPPAWASVIVAIAGVAGLGLARSLAPGRAPPRGGRWVSIDLPTERLDKVASPRTLAGAVAALGTAAVMLWLVGLARGFL
jgi:hypothetical protein